MSIRMATKEDIPRILEIYAPYVENTTYSFEYTVPTLEAFTQRFRDITGQFAWLVWEENGRVMGYAYGSAPFHRAAYGWCAEVSAYLDPAVQGKGIGRTLYGEMEKLLCRQGYRKVYAIVTSENTGSLAFHEAVGYTKTAVFPDCGYKFGRWLGTIWLEKSLNSGDLPVCPPVPIWEIVKNDRIYQ